ncbi:MAG: DUF3429 domain-containing protein [Bacteroidota bacterium]|nr:DUF3429 domain-containing protein [Kiloniellaceae bacterium]
MPEPLSAETGRARLAAVPHPALILGFAGLIPFLACAAGAWAGAAGDSLILVTAQIGYGAVVLGFLGAVHWGLAIAQAAADNWRRLLPAVLPALLGWIAFLLPAPLGLALLALGFAGAYFADRAAVTANRAPAWYAALRKPLTLVVLLSLGASYGALAAKI